MGCCCNRFHCLPLFTFVLALLCLGGAASWWFQMTQLHYQIPQGDINSILWNYEQTEELSFYQGAGQTEENLELTIPYVEQADPFTSQVWAYYSMNPVPQMYPINTNLALVSVFLSRNNTEIKTDYFSFFLNTGSAPGAFSVVSPVQTFETEWLMGRLPVWNGYNAGVPRYSTVFVGIQLSEAGKAYCKQHNLPYLEPSFRFELNYLNESGEGWMSSGVFYSVFVALTAIGFLLILTTMLSCCVIGCATCVRSKQCPRSQTLPVAHTVVLPNAVSINSSESIDRQPLLEPTPAHSGVTFSHPVVTSSLTATAASERRPLLEQQTPVVAISLPSSTSYQAGQSLYPALNQ